MNRFLLILMASLVGIIFFSCNSKQLGMDVYDSKYYQRVTKYGDSVSNMFVIYKSTVDTNRTYIKYYWDNGQLQAISYFYKNLKDGTWEQYFSDGVLSFEGKFAFGRKVGLHKTYSPNGNLLIKEDYTDSLKVKK